MARPLSRAHLSARTVPCGDMSRFYAVHSPSVIGVFLSWEDTRRYVDGVSGARHKKFGSAEAAHKWLATQPALSSGAPAAWRSSGTAGAQSSGPGASASRARQLPASSPASSPPAAAPSPPAPAADAVEGILPENMSRQQWHVYRLAVWEGRSLFYTGKAGTGKSSLLASILRDLGRPAAVLAPTGTAAVNIGPMATTIHSFAVRGHRACATPCRAAPTPPPRAAEDPSPRWHVAEGH